MTSLAYKYRIYPTDEQEIILSKTFGCVRFVWNQMVETFNSYDKDTNPKPVYESTTILRSQIPWLKEVNAATLQKKQIDFNNFRKQYFSKKRKKKIWRPSFKKKSNHQSFRLPNQKFYLGQNFIHLEKIGNITIQIDRLPNKDSKFLSVTISKTPSGKYYASVLVEEEVTPRFAPTGKSIGLDLGLKDFLILSNGEKVENPRWLRKSQAKLRKTQKNLSRKVIGINFDYFSPQLSNSNSDLSRVLFVPKLDLLTKHFADTDARFGTFMSKSFGGARLHLTVLPVIATKNTGEKLPKMHYNFNYNLDVPPDGGYQTLIDFINDRGTYKDHTQTILHDLEVYDA